MTPAERRALAGLPPLTDPWASVPPKLAEPTPASKASNPKEAFGSNKLPLHLFPPSATALGSLAFLHGALKYGRGNWRAVGVRASTYFEALCRHLFAWWEGEDTDPDNGLPHLAHVLACAAILVDAGAAGKLNDDRPYPGGYAALVAALVPHVTRLKKAAEGLDEPEHFTRQSIFSKGKS